MIYSQPAAQAQSPLTELQGVAPSPTFDTMTSNDLDGTLWEGRAFSHRDQQIKIVDARDPDEIHTRNVKSERRSTLTLKTLHEKYRRVSPEIPAVLQPEIEPVHAAIVEDEDDGEPIEAVTPGVSIVRTPELAVYHHEREAEDTVRDLDLAERAGLSKRRGIRVSIRELIESGLIAECQDAGIIGRTEDDDLSPRAYAVDVLVGVGKGARRLVTEYHLNEAAALMLVMHLRTPKALEIKRAVVATFILVRRGRLKEAANVSRGKREVSSSDPLATQIAAIDRLEAAGVIDARTAAVQNAIAVSRATGVDLTVAPGVVFGRWAPASETLAQLTEGRSAIVTIPVDLTGHHSATAVGRRHRPEVSSLWVGQVARAFGIYENEEFGKSSPFQKNGREFKRTWDYNEAAIEKMKPVLEAIAKYLESRNGKRASRAAIREIIASHVPRSQAA